MYVNPAFILLDGAEDMVGIYLAGQDALDDMESTDICVPAIALLDEDGYMLKAEEQARIEMN